MQNDIPVMCGRNNLFLRILARLTTPLFPKLLTPPPYVFALLCAS
jgi:hypothetical protein